MKPHFASFALVAVVGLSSVAAPLRAQTLDDLLTRAERSDFVETSSYEDVMAMAEALARLSDRIHLTSFGYTNEGRRLPLLVLGAPDASPESVLATGKTRIYLQGNIHAGRSAEKRRSSCSFATTPVANTLPGPTTWS